MPPSGLERSNGIAPATERQRCSSKRTDGRYRGSDDHESRADAMASVGIAEVP